MEPYEFMYQSPFRKSPVLVYRCYRGGCKGTKIWVADRNTHNAMHNRVDGND